MVVVGIRNYRYHYRYDPSPKQRIRSIIQEKDVYKFFKILGIKIPLKKLYTDTKPFQVQYYNGKWYIVKENSRDLAKNKKLLKFLKKKFN